MFSSIQLINEETEDQRDGKRYRARGNLEISKSGNRVSSGDIINISRTGVAFRCYSALSVGTEYSVIIDGLGEYSGTVVRTFGGNNFGLQFNMSHSGFSRLESRLAEMYSAK